MKKTLLLAAVSTTFLSAQAAPQNTIPPWKSYTQTGNPADIVSSTTVANAIGTKVDAVSGQSQGETLTTPSISGATTFSLEGDPTLTVNPVGIGSRTVKSSLYSDTVAKDGTTSIWPNVIQTSSSTGYGNTDPVWGGEADRINLFMGMNCLSGSSSCWAENALLYAASGFQANGHGSEIDVENYSTDRDPSVSGSKPINGLEVTGGSSAMSSYAIDIVGNTNTIPHLFHDGIGILGGIAKDNSIIDVGDATESVHILGSHGIGVDTAYSNISGASFLMNTNQHLDFLNTTTNAEWTGISANLYGIVIGANAPEVVLGDGGGNNYAFMGATDNSVNSTTLFAAGAQPNIDINIQAKGTGAVNVNTLAGNNLYAGKTLQLPVTTSAPTGSCNTGLMQVSNNELYVCLNSTWVQK